MPPRIEEHYCSCDDRSDGTSLGRLGTIQEIVNNAL